MASITTWLKRWRRLFANRCADAGDIRTRLPQAALDRLAARVAASEQQHAGEIRICIEAGLPWSYIRRDATARDRALTLFGKLRVWDTEHNNGVLIYLLLAEHAIELIADRGLNARIGSEHWAGITAELSRTLSERRFEEGLNQAIDALSAVLATHFPREGDTPKSNELPDAPVMLV
ncbi:MAG: TPM domain-containing protein [Candidatus Competibacteraceae bacterium]|nr:TPM domain-containing protein [Candidatus Competibacteraceae bacterium]MBK8896512.1 TPM domain-containing protein [Candidatus Competibacteraceae bacterium]MBK8964112.1 TPM domain-containing protein [Candidatus Competibacteraceae bacterium]MBK9953507.1 TPM domain-containing protein [Candidatus Competibacteraceae bacterium]